MGIGIGIKLFFNLAFYTSTLKLPVSSNRTLHYLRVRIQEVLRPKLSEAEFWPGCDSNLTLDTATAPRHG